MKESTRLEGIGYELKIEVLSGVHRGVYHSVVIENNDDTLCLTMPVFGGRLIPLGVGQIVKVTYCGEQTFSFETEIIERRLKPQPAICIPKPYTISRAGRCYLPGMTRVIAVTSGKGGVGKTNFTINIALALINLGQRVMVIDADLGLANIDVVLGITPQYDLTHVIKGKKGITEIITDGPGGFKFIAGATGVQELGNLSEWQISRLVTSLSELEKTSDIILIDTGAGISDSVLSFILAADEVIVITTPEPTAMADAYAMIKIIARKNKQQPISLVVNRADNADEAMQTAKRLMAVSERFLGISLNQLGYVANDSCVSLAVKKQQAFIRAYPHTEASKCIKHIANELCYGKDYEHVEIKRKNFFNRLLELFTKV